MTHSLEDAEYRGRETEVHSCEDVAALFEHDFLGVASGPAEWLKTARCDEHCYAERIHVGCRGCRNVLRG